MSDFLSKAFGNIYIFKKEKIDYLLALRIDGISRTLKNIHTNISWNEAKRLFELVDHDNVFLSKIKEAPIQHISNAFSNLKKIDSKCIN